MIDSEQGRIGELWWINSDPATLIAGNKLLPGLSAKQKFVRWGTCGIGRDITVHMEPLND